MKKKNITIVGLGYVGLVTAVCFSNMGYNVVGLDISKEKVKKLNEGMIDFYEPELKEMLLKNKERLIFTYDNKLAYKSADYIFLCVQTPESINGEADMSYVLNVINDITEEVTYNCILVIKSTVPIGTNKKIVKLIKKKAKDKVNIEVVSNPEFLSQGTAIKDTVCPDRIVIGSDNISSSNKVKELYKDLNTKYLITDSNSAEMIKYASNCFLAVKISYINEIANLCEKIGADIEDVSKGLKLDKRIGKYFLKSGVGYGGSCFPKDTKALKFMAEDLNLKLNIIDATIQDNDMQNLILIDKARKYYNSFNNVNIAILGVTFKPNTDDIREAPAIKNIEIFLEEGANIKIYDPKGLKKVSKIYKNIKCCKTIDQTLKDSDICFIFTEWQEIEDIDLNVFEKYMNRAIVMDGRNCYELNQVRKYNIIYESIGRNIIMNKHIKL